MYPGSLCLALVGLTMLWAIRILESDRELPGNPIALGFRIAAILFLVVGSGIFSLSVGGPLIWFIGLGAAGEIWRRSALARRRAMLQLAAVASERDLPLPEVLEALARDYSRPFRRRVHRLAELLRAGAPLATAVEAVPRALPPQALAGVRVGEAVGNLGAGLRAVDAWLGEDLSRYRLVRRGLGYLTMMFTACALVISFFIHKLLPVLQQIELDFGSRARWLARIADWAFGAPAMWILVIGLPLSILVIVLMLLWDFGVVSARSPGLGWLARPDPEILRSVGLAAEREISVPTVLGELARAHPVAAVRRRLARAVTAMLGGTPWIAALAQHRLVRPANAALLEAAERAGNLPWACRELAASTLRRQTYRLSIWLQWITPLAIVAIGILIGAFVIAVFATPVEFIWTLTERPIKP